MGSSRLRPEEDFPEDLEVLEDTTVEVINSKLHRQSAEEYREGSSEPETEFRLEEVRHELDDRDAGGTDGASENR